MRRARSCIALSIILLMATTTRSRAQAPVNTQQEVARVAEMREVHAAFDWLQANEANLRKTQVEMVKIPAPPFGEAKRAEWLKQQFTALGLEDVSIDKVGNVLGVSPGSDKSSKYVSVSAHIDTVFPAGTAIDVRTEGEKIFAPGISDNGAGVSALLAMAGVLKEKPIAHKMSILFVGDVGEEGEGDLRGMRYLFGESPWGAKIAYSLVLDGAGTDSIVNAALGSHRYEVTVRGPGGHSWSDFGEPNAIVILARAAAEFSKVPLPKEPKTTHNIGTISGGTSVNSIPEEATMRVDIRSSSPQEIARVEGELKSAVERAVNEANASRKGKKSGVPVTYEMKLIGSRPAADLPADSRMLDVLRAVDSHLGLKSNLRRASTDANIPMALGREAVSIGAGGTGGGAHTEHEWYDPSGRDLGLKRILLSLLTLTGVE